MKFAANPATAIRLSTQLRELLVKGGFRLTKLLSNDKRVPAEIPKTEKGVSLKQTLTYKNCQLSEHLD